MKLGTVNEHRLPRLSGEDDESRLFHDAVERVDDAAKWATAGGLAVGAAFRPGTRRFR